MKKLNITGSLKKAAFVGGGAVAAAAINKLSFVQKVEKKMIVAAAKLGLAAFLPSMIGKGKSKAMVEDMAAGFTAIATVELVNTIIAKNDPSKALGISGMPVIAGYASPSYAINNGQEGIDDVM